MWPHVKKKTKKAPSPMRSKMTQAKKPIKARRKLATDDQSVEVRFKTRQSSESSDRKRNRNRNRNRNTNSNSKFKSHRQQWQLNAVCFLLVSLVLLTATSGQQIYVSNSNQLKSGPAESRGKF